MSEEDKALRQARDTADQVQLRIIEAKLAKGEKLFPDEETLLAKQRTTANASLEAVNEDLSSQLGSLPEFQALTQIQQTQLITKISTILSLSKKIKTHFAEHNIVSEFEQVDILHSNEEWRIGTTEDDRLWAFHHARGKLSQEDLLDSLIHIKTNEQKP